MLRQIASIALITVSAVVLPNASASAVEEPNGVCVDVPRAGTYCVLVDPTR